MAVLEAPTYRLSAAVLIVNPDRDDLRRLTAAMPNARWTEFGNLNMHTCVDGAPCGQYFPLKHAQANDQPTRRGPDSNVAGCLHS